MLKYKHILTAISLSALTHYPYTVFANEHLSSPNVYGQLGLNTQPNARMDTVGTVRAGLSTLDPYAHSWLSFQFVDPLNITLRQSAEISSINEDAKRLYPGLDLKLRIVEETRSVPAIAIGIQSAVGHKKMAGEYIAFSKRYKMFDFTSGIGWGRYGNNGQLENPLSSLSNHFEKKRAPDNEEPNSIENWFNGNVGLFLGAEYITPIENLSLKFDYSADDYPSEKKSGFNRPAPWSIGLDYALTSHTNLAIATQGTDKIMGRFSLKTNLNSIGKRAKRTPVKPLNKERSAIGTSADIYSAASRNKINLQKINVEKKTLDTQINLNDSSSLPHDLAIATHSISNNAANDIEKITYHTFFKGLRGPDISLNRRDYELAIARNNGSAQEIWHNTEIDSPNELSFIPRSHAKNLFFKLKNQSSLSEEDSGLLHRTSLIAGIEGYSPRYSRIPVLQKMRYQTSLRLNIEDNLENLNRYRFNSPLPVRSNIDKFTDKFIGLETGFINYAETISPDFHLNVMTGYLEEMYSGAGGEILYRPYKSRWAIGAESWLAFKRDPDSFLSMTPNGDHLLTGHINGWYNFQKPDITIYAKAGRYLAEDIGITIGAQKSFDNGSKLEGFMTVTDGIDYDPYGGATHAYNGFRLSIPMGGYKYIPENTSADFEASPFGRDYGQVINNPLPLYELTDKFSLKNIAQNWDDITP
ncbi:MAG: YjbH domain-containing protein [Micavibrio sp.]|nr:YjbH domain-containing protein [Micavibrio sp.]